MRVRKLDGNYDMRFGHGQEDYFLNDPDGVAQLVLTRLEMNVGDWFLNLQDGTPWRLKVLGRRTDTTRDAAIRARIIATQGVTAIKTYASQVNRQSRAFSGQVLIDTAYSANAVTVPTPAGSLVDVRQGR